MRGRAEFDRQAADGLLVPPRCLLDDGDPESADLRQQARLIRVLSYNIQTGLQTRHYADYLTRSWQYMVPHPARPRNIDRISDLLIDFDLVGLQEVDAGSLRSGFINQTRYLSDRAGFPFWVDQINRRLGVFAQHSNGLLARFVPREVQDHRLPGVIPGRGLIHLSFGMGAETLQVFLMHLSLGRRTRILQLSYVAELLRDCRHAIVMGDLNCPADSPELRRFLDNTGLREPLGDLRTYPSWRPERSLDHILVTNTLAVRRAAVVPFPVSDHLPVMMELLLPEGLALS